MAKSNSPLSSTKRKKRSYVGNLDDLMADVSEEESSEEALQEKGAPGAEDDPADSEEEAPPPQKHLNLKIDESLHTRFKGVVGMQGRTMTEVLEELMRGYVRESVEKLDL